MEDPLADAIAFAAKAHAGQKDKAGEPYILHPIRVMMSVREPTRQIVAVLHDVVEDCDVSLGMIEERFGEEVRHAVDALTKRKGESYHDFIERCCRNRIARDVKFQDLGDNLSAERIGRLPKAEQERLVAKYRPALHQVFVS